MGNTTLFDDGSHKNILMEDFADGGAAVQANQHLIVHNGKAMILDPGGHKIYSKLLSATMHEIGGGELQYIFLSHQDPDIVAACNGWLMTTDADAYCSELWTRFVPHFGLDNLVVERLKPIPDEGMSLDLGGVPLLLVPAHFMHSCGNFQVYDPISKILYTGDLGASLGQSYVEVPDFDAHIQYMEGFHRRYIASNSILRAWAAMARCLDIEIIAPQHGALFRGTDHVNRFIDWCEQLECGVDLIANNLKAPVMA
ncbi:MAG: FprA family A-type flavoprotein [Planctomycetes bacterium]|nr:FprA family A-type flavoprotein [Planctomycetota bacterium]